MKLVGLLPSLEAEKQTQENKANGKLNYIFQKKLENSTNYFNKKTLANDLLPALFSFPKVRPYDPQFVDRLSDSVNLHDLGS